MTVSCIYAGINELGITKTYIKLTSRPLETIAIWLMQDERVFNNILQIINSVEPDTVDDQTLSTTSHWNPPDQSDDRTVIQTDQADDDLHLLEKSSVASIDYA